MKTGRPRGVALISALMVMVIMVIIASAFVQLTARDVRSSKTAGDTLMTLYLAEAGIEYALWVTKHNMNVYPSVAYDVNPWDASATAVQRGSVISLIPTASGSTQEHVVINDLSYEGDNWLGQTSYCGTFQVSQVLSRSGTTITATITSIGRVREVPAGWNWATGDLRAALPDSPSPFNRVRSQRTITSTFQLDMNTDILTSTQIPANSKSAAVREAKWYEKFR